MSRAADIKCASQPSDMQSQSSTLPERTEHDANAQNVEHGSRRNTGNKQPLARRGRRHAGRRPPHHDSEKALARPHTRRSQNRGTQGSTRKKRTRLAGTRPKAIRTSSHTSQQEANIPRARRKPTRTSSTSHHTALPQNVRALPRRRQTIKAPNPVLAPARSYRVGPIPKHAPSSCDHKPQAHTRSTAGKTPPPPPPPHASRKKYQTAS